MATDLVELRRRVRPLLDLSAPRDALAAYYTLYHDPSRTRVYVEERGKRIEGFLTICQTGRDLFRLLAVLRARTLSAARALIERHLHPRRPYYLVTTLDLQPVVETTLLIEQTQINRIYRLDLRRYTPTLNVLVVPTPTPDGSPRFVIRVRGEVAAEAGVNWQSPHFAEVYVWTAPEARGRGWGKAVLDSCIAWVLRTGVQPLYVAPERNAPSIRLAESTGFVDTGAREFAVEAVRLAE
ncbi:MAG TPA: GNAT family N-acetyltransferase [Chloroflexi bacterium]|nr:GNAT family N-acetyltransferase [Chloroflexota bacterium]